METWTTSERHDWEVALMVAFGGLIGALAAFVHWRRFKVAITIAAGIGALVVLLLSLLGAALGDSETTEVLLPPAALICGLAVFAYAMKWDFSDTARKTNKADIAFWLHLLAAPLIAHPLFYWIGVTDGREIGTLAALAVLAVYIGFGMIALAIDRRALLVSALAYVLIALGGLFRRYGAVELNVALTALVIGSALLALSAYWTPIRTALLARLPEAWRARLPRGAALAT